MTSYGGYSSTAYGAGGGDDGGGFVYGGSQSGSQSGGGKGYSDESLRPVTIKQIIDAQQAYPDAPFRIDGAEVTQVTFVGMVRGVSPQTTNITFKLDDGTGLIEAKRWIDVDKPDDTARNQFPLDSYVRVWGRLKSFNNKRHVGAHVIKPVADFNEVGYHMLESTYVHLSLTKGAPDGGAAGAGGAAAGGAAADGGDSMFVDGGMSAESARALASCSPKAKKMFQWLNSAEGGNEGIHLQQIASGTGLSVGDTMAASEELMAPGLIYTTVDDETFAILSY